MSEVNEQLVETVEPVDSVTPEVSPENSPEETTLESVVDSEVSKEEKPEEKQGEKANGEPFNLVKHLRKHIDAQAKKLHELEKRVAQAQEVPAPVKEHYQDEAEYSRANQQYQEKQAQRTTLEMQRLVEETALEHDDFSIDKIGHLNFHIPTLVEAVSTLQHGKEILYHLSKNPEEASELSLLSKGSPALFEQKLVELHSTIRRSKQQPKKVASSAPRPAKTVGSRGTVKVDPAKMTDSEWLAWKREQRIQQIKQRMG